MRSKHYPRGVMCIYHVKRPPSAMFLSLLCTSAHDAHELSYYLRCVIRRNPLKWKWCRTLPRRLRLTLRFPSSSSPPPPTPPIPNTATLLAQQGLLFRLVLSLRHSRRNAQGRGTCANLPRPFYCANLVSPLQQQFARAGTAVLEWGGRPPASHGGMATRVVTKAFIDRFF